jgi:thiamine-phosphate pyrophosphorylase
MASTFREQDGVSAGGAEHDPGGLRGYDAERRPGGEHSGGWRVPASLYFITMDGAPIDHLQQVESACRAGIRWIQLRMKQASDADVRDIALAAKVICTVFDCTLIIDDRVAVAAAVGADGVHLGNEDMTVSEARRLLGKDKIIGGTANVAEDIEEHYRQGADYIGLGPYRYTTTKKKLSPILGLEGYRQIMNRLRQEQIHIPVIAIGGIGVEDVAPLLDAGLAGVAFSGMLVHSDNPKGLVEVLEGEVSRASGAPIKAAN